MFCQGTVEELTEDTGQLAVFGPQQVATDLLYMGSSSVVGE